MFLPGASTIFGDFHNILLPNTDENQKKSYHLRAMPLALCLMKNPALVIALQYDHKKVSRGPEVATFRTKNR